METLNYWESREINIGHFEKRHFGMSYTISVKKYNNEDKTVKITHSEKIELADGDEFNKVAKTLCSRVKKVLDSKEKFIREAIANVETELELDHIEKLKAMRITVSDEILKKVSKKVKARTENSIEDSWEDD